jgi:hypothetical protein
MSTRVVNKKKTSEETESADLLAAIDAGIQTMQAQLKLKGAGKGTLSDLVRLLQLRKELNAEKPRHVSARWIDEEECKNSRD